MAGILKEGPIRKRLREQRFLKRSPERSEDQVIEKVLYLDYNPQLRQLRIRGEKGQFVIDNVDRLVSAEDVRWDKAHGAPGFVLYPTFEVRSSDGHCSIFFEEHPVDIEYHPTTKDAWIRKR